MAAALATGSDARHASLLRSPVELPGEPPGLTAPMAAPGCSSTPIATRSRFADALPRTSGGCARTRATQTAVASRAGVDQSVLSRVEAGSRSPTVQTYARIAAALGADLAARVYPQTGPRIRDRHQVRMAEVVIASLHPRLAGHAQVAVRSPVRGWIDLALHDPGAQLVVAGELESSCAGWSS